MREARIISAIGGIALLALGNANGLYAGDHPTATIRFQKGYDKGVELGAASTQKYMFLKDGSCTKTKVISRFSWTNKPTKDVAVEAGRKLRFEAQTNRIIGGIDGGSGWCQNLFAFTPKARGVYLVTQVSKVMVDCHVEVIDLATENAPNDFETFDRGQCVKQL